MRYLQDGTRSWEQLGLLSPAGFVPGEHGNTGR